MLFTLELLIIEPGPFCLLHTILIISEMITFAKGKQFYLKGN
jgi:hypothetical protein